MLSLRHEESGEKFNQNFATSRLDELIAAAENLFVQ